MRRRSRLRALCKLLYDDGWRCRPVRTDGYRELRRSARTLSLRRLKRAVGSLYRMALDRRRPSDTPREKFSVEAEELY